MSPPPNLGPKPVLGYTDSRIERAAELRGNTAAIETMAKGAGAGAYVIGGDLIVTKKGASLSDPLFTLAEARTFARSPKQFSSVISITTAASALVLRRTPPRR